jgi:uncharacterized protein YdeI (YjbR/CyaY-like superfamily)
VTDSIQLHFVDRRRWRAWLRQHHRKTKEVWLVFYKKRTGLASISYDAAVEEALCYGWIDSIVKRLDDERYARKFTPRTDTRRWSPSNLARARRLIAAGRMTKAGLAKLDADLDAPAPAPARSLRVPPFFAAALKRNPAAREFFDSLAPSYRRHYVGWVSSAKREETRARRLEEAVALLAAGKKLGLK